MSPLPAPWRALAGPSVRSVVVLGAVFGLVLLVGWPLLLLGGSLLADPAALAAVTDPHNLRAAGNTVRLCGGVLAVALGLGVPLGFLLGRTDLPGRAAWRSLCTAPYVVPPYIAAIAWITLLNPTNGALNRLLRSAGLPVLDIYGLGGMIFVVGLETTPFVLLATADALARMDASLEEQARIAGADPLRVLLRITLPLATPALLVASSFVLASAAASFGVPYLLASGTATPDFVLTTRITQALELDPRSGRPVAVALSLVLLAIGVGLPWLAALFHRGLVGGARATLVTGKATRVAPFALGRATAPALLLVATFVFVAVVLPLGTVALTSVLVNVGGGLSADNLTLGNYRAVLLERSDTLAALGRSAILAAGAATVATALGALLAWNHQRGGGRAGAWAAGLARLPYAVPGTVLALGLLLAWSQEIRLIVLDRVTFALALGDTMWLLGLAYVVKFLAFPVGRTEAGLSALDPALEEAARMGGASFPTTLRRITAPLLRADLLGAWFLVFLPALTEVTMSILLSGPDTRVVGTLIFDLQTYGDPPAAAVLAVVVTAIVLGGNAVVRIATGGRAGL